MSLKHSPASCVNCHKRLQPSVHGRPKLYCNTTCRNREFHRRDPGYRRWAYQKLYSLHPERERKRARDFYWRTKKQKVRVVTWSVVELLRPPALILPSFSGTDDPFGYLADYELRHLLADFENEEGAIG